MAVEKESRAEKLHYFESGKLFICIAFLFSFTKFIEGKVGGEVEGGRLRCLLFYLLSYILNSGGD